MTTLYVRPTACDLSVPCPLSFRPFAEACQALLLAPLLLHLGSADAFDVRHDVDPLSRHWELVDERLLRTQHAEFVALGVGKHGPRLGAGLPDVHPAGT